MEGSRLYDMLAEIHKQLVMISMHLATLAKVAHDQHPEFFTQPGVARVNRPPDRS